MKKRFLMCAATALTVLLLAVLLTVGASAAETKIENDDGLRIGYGNLVFKDTIYLRYAVSTETYSADDMVLLVWTEAQDGVDGYVYGTQDLVLTATGTTSIQGVTHAVFDYKGLTAKQMTDYIYARAYVSDDGNTSAGYGKTVKYSVLQYSYSLLGKTGTSGTTNEKLINLINAMLNYGAAAQEYTEYKTDWLANDAFYEVKVVGGALPDGMTNGLYKKGSKVVITADAPAAGYKFVGWQNADGEIESTDAAYEVTVGEVNAVYTAAYEEDVKYSQGLKFTSNGDGTCYVSGIGTCTDTDLVIPPTSPEGWKVTQIGGSVFKGNENIKSIIIPEGVTDIGYCTFMYCKNLQSIEIPSSMRFVAQDAFRNSYNLTYVNFTGTIEQWCGIYFADECSTPITYARKLYIKDELVENIVLRDDISITIEDYAFYNCDSLISIQLPTSVKAIGDYSFSRCDNLMGIEIPSSITYIGKYAFDNSIGLKTVVLAASVKRIGSGAFRDCPNISNVIYKGDVSGWLNILFDNDWSSPCNNYAELNIYGEKVVKLIIPKSITKLNDDAFCGCTSLESVEFEEGSLLIDVGRCAFLNCSNLRSIVIPNSVTSIGFGAFDGCTSLTDIYYLGTEEEWAIITINSGNTPLLNATIHYNYSPTPKTPE